MKYDFSKKKIAVWCEGKEKMAFLEKIEELHPDLRWDSGDKPTGWTPSYDGIEFGFREGESDFSIVDKKGWYEKEDHADKTITFKEYMSQFKGVKK